MKLFFRKYGQGQPLIILHGLFGQSDNWNTLAKKFSENGLQAYIVDLRNHGQSPHDDEMNYEVMARDVKELVDAESIQSPVMMGHSMGGKVTMMFDRLYPDVLKKLIVVDILPKQYPGGHTEVFQALNAVNFDLVKTRKDAEDILRQHLKDEAVIQFLLKNIHWETAERLNWRFNLSVIQKNYENILAEIPYYQSLKPCLFLRGERSSYIKDEDEHLIKRYYPAAELVRIPHAGHWIHAEQPQLFMQAVLQFLKQ
ncbi:MAG: alpha/beta fold hydrolase [Bacteroidetes bacterium]|nr:MAG: alpha/beta fold hydrolase [Bacteroidota bacterium]